MSEACSAILEASRRYAASIEGLAWDNVLDAAPLLQAYILGGRRGVVTGLDSDKQAARLLWSMLSVWGHIWDPMCNTQGQRGECEDIMCAWVRRGTHLIRALRNNLRPLIEKLARLPEAPRPEDIGEAEDSLASLHEELVKLGRELGLRYAGVAATKTIAILTLFHLPPVDTSIASNVARCNPQDTQCYLNTVKSLAQLLQVCLNHPGFNAYIAERRASTRSTVRAKPFKVLDEGLWFIAQPYWGDQGSRERVYEEVRRLTSNA